MPADLASVLAPRLMEPGLADLHPAVAALPRLGPAPATLGPRRDRDPAAVRDAARQLESFFLTMLLQEMRAPGLFDADEEGWFVPSREERLFLQQLDQALGDELARTGQLGLAEVIARQLLPPEPLP